MTAVVFVGPTLMPVDLERFGHFTFLPPVAQGDLYLACRSRPPAVGIIDGYFDGVPAVWHKEILWAMAEGIHVFGSASMGALRAAELHTFGMRGCGWVFRAFRDGELTDDDEVAIQHGPVETGYRTVSLPMVNVRATVVNASSAGLLDADGCVVVLDAAKAQLYRERTWDSVLETARARLGVATIEEFGQWLSGGGEVDQKRADALEMLASMDAFLREHPGPMTVDYAFEETQLWAHAAWKDPRRSLAPGAAVTADDRGVLDELRLDPGAYERVRRQALLRMLVRGELNATSQAAGRSAALRQVRRFRLSSGLLSGAALERWLEENGMTAEDLHRSMADEASLIELEQEFDSELGDAMLDQLRLDGHYTVLAARAGAKARTRRSLGVTETVHEGVGRNPLLLDSWYFEQRMETDIPDDLDSYARWLGLDGKAALRRLLAEEYRELGQQEGGGGDSDQEGNEAGSQPSCNSDG